MYQAQRMQTTMDMALSALLWKGNPELDPSESGFLFNEERQAWEFRNISQEDRDVFLAPRCNCKKGCQNGVCSCRKAERACSGVCGCVFLSAFNCCCNKKKKGKTAPQLLQVRVLQCGDARHVRSRRGKLRACTYWARGQCAPRKWWRTHRAGEGLWRRKSGGLATILVVKR